ncbi:helix-turn-helix domain-containing protein [Streptomyces misionensis]|uniref:helix-turn-helix domain-containing protein n=1 Tax=Streptomyces misionensis TaxID=67331 RepID=UPI00368ACBE6
MPQRRATTGRSQEPRARFIEELRLLRDERQLTFRALAAQVGWDPTLFSKMEKGQSLGGPETVAALDTFYGTGDKLLTLWELAKADPTQFKERYWQYMSLEARAVSMWHYAASNLPGVLQTSEYAAELLQQGGLSGAELESQVAARTGRRELLLADGAPHFRTILSETVLHSPLRDPDAWRAQLSHLLAMGERSNVIVQVLPLSAGLHALTNTDAMFLRDAEGRTFAWVETGYSGELVQEPTAVEVLQFRYDRVRDLALSPDESREFIKRMLEEAPCEPSI